MDTLFSPLKSHYIHPVLSELQGQSPLFSLHPSYSLYE